MCVEHDLEQIWQSVCGALGDALNAAGIDGERVAGIGITIAIAQGVKAVRALGNNFFNTHPV